MRAWDVLLILAVAPPDLLVGATRAVGCEALVSPGFKFGVQVFPAGSSSSVDQCVGFSSTAAITEAVGVARRASMNDNFAAIKAKSSYNIKQKAEENAFDASKDATLARDAYESGEHKDLLDALSDFQALVSAAAAELKVAAEVSARAKQVLEAAEKKFALSSIDHNKLLCAEKACVFDCALASITNWKGNPLLKHGEALPKVSDADSSVFCKEHTVYNHCAEVCSGPPTCKYGVLSSKPSCTAVPNSIHTTPAITTMTTPTPTKTKPCITTQGSLKAKGIFKFAIEGTSDIGAQGHQVKFMRGTKDMLAAGSAQYMGASKTFQDVAGMSTASDYLVSFAVVNKNGAIMNMQRSFNAYTAVQETLKGCPAILDISSVAGRSATGLTAKSGDEMEAVFVVDVVGDSGIITPKTFKLKYSWKALSGPM